MAIKKESSDQELKVNENCLKYHYVVLQVFGIWIDIPKKGSIRTLYNIYAFTVLTLFFILYPVSEMVHLYMNFENIYAATFQFTYILSHILGFAKMGLIFIFKENIDKHRKHLQSGVFVPNLKRGGPIEMEYVNNAVKINYIQATFFHGFLCLMLFLFNLNAFMNNISTQEYFDPALNETIERQIRLTPYSNWLPFESIESPYYEIACFYQISSNVFYGFTIGASDALICGILCQIKAQLLILINSLNTYMNRMEILLKDDGYNINLDKYSKTIIKDGMEIVELFPAHIQKYADRCFRDCIIHHQQIIDLAKANEETFNYLMLIQFLGSLLLICFQLFQLSVVRKLLSINHALNSIRENHPDKY